MGKLIRYYNQNRIGIWIVILIFAFLILIIQALNGLAKEQNKQVNVNNDADKNITNQVDYTTESKSVVSGDEVPEIYQKNFGSTLENFLTYCKNHEPEKAYGLLSNECKEVLYPSVQDFTNSYYNCSYNKNPDCQYCLYLHVLY